MRVITFSRTFPSYHPRKGEPTFFVEKITIGLGGKYLPEPYPIQDLDQLQILQADPKYHTIRAGNRWKVGDLFSPRVWSDKPYRSKQIEFALPIEIKKITPVYIYGSCIWKMESEHLSDQIDMSIVSKNDGLTEQDFKAWFNNKPVKGQIICWNGNINY